MLTLLSQRFKQFEKFSNIPTMVWADHLLLIGAWLICPRSRRPASFPTTVSAFKRKFLLWRIFQSRHSCIQNLFRLCKNICGDSPGSYCLFSNCLSPTVHPWVEMHFFQSVCNLMIILSSSPISVSRLMLHRPLRSETLQLILFHFKLYNIISPSFAFAHKCQTAIATHSNLPLKMLLAAKVFVRHSLLPM